MNGFLERIARQPRAGHRDDFWPDRESPVQLVTKYDGAAADADEDDVNPEANAGPQVNLENRLAEPQALRPPQPPIPERHVFINNIAVSR